MAAALEVGPGIDDLNDRDSTVVEKGFLPEIPQSQAQIAQSRTESTVEEQAGSHTVIKLKDVQKRIGGVTISKKPQAQKQTGPLDYIAEHQDSTFVSQMKTNDLVDDENYTNPVKADKLNFEIENIHEFMKMDATSKDKSSNTHTRNSLQNSSKQMRLSLDDSKKVLPQLSSDNNSDHETGSSFSLT